MLTCFQASSVASAGPAKKQQLPVQLCQSLRIGVGLCLNQSHCSRMQPSCLFSLPLGGDLLGSCPACIHCQLPFGGCGPLLCLSPLLGHAALPEGVAFLPAQSEKFTSHQLSLADWAGARHRAAHLMHHPCCRSKQPQVGPLSRVRVASPAAGRCCCRILGLW